VIGLEAMRMVEQGVASAADIDTAMKLGYGHPMGPLELTDLVGLDVRLGIAEHLAEALGPAFTRPDVLRDKVAAGKLGKKTGEGFYRWAADGKAPGSDGRARDRRSSSRRYHNAQVSRLRAPFAFSGRVAACSSRRFCGSSASRARC
jgi:3-hydroxybutyryl-CoA dehydrogenase